MGGVDENKLIILLLFFYLLFFCSTLGRAGVGGSKHDMYFNGRGAIQEICWYCHIPHNAAGDKIWSDWGNEAQLMGGPSTTIGNMCYTCHDGTVTDIGQNTVFNNSLQQHKISSGRDCDMCHDPHDDTNGKFMKVAESQNSYCASCHNSVVNAGGLGDHTGLGNHPSYATSPSAGVHNTGAGCNVCHSVEEGPKFYSCYRCHDKGHSAVMYSTAEISNPILKADNTDSQLCGGCHVANLQNTVGGFKHPANLSSSGSWGKVSCESCHDPHQSDKPNFPFLLQQQNIDSSFCVNCHDLVNEANGPNTGHGHPENVPFLTEPTDPEKAPAGNAIDDDGFNGIDYPFNSSNMICESCHSMHRKGIDAPLLRETQSGSAFCLNCHNNL